MLDAPIVNSILAPYDLELTTGGLRTKSMKFAYGTVGMEAIYEMMFIHNLSRDEALIKISKLLNTATKGLKSIIVADSILPKDQKPRKTKKP